MRAATSVVGLLVALSVSSASLADDLPGPPWDGWDSWRESNIQVGWDYGYETGTLNDASVTVDLVSVVGASTTNQQCWNYQSWTAPADDNYRFTFNYNASGWASLSGASVFGDANWIAMRVVLRIIPSGTTWEEGPYRYNYWRCVAATSGIPYIPTLPYEYDEDVYVTTGPIWFQEGETVSIGGGLQILPTCVSLIGFVSILGENTGQLNSVQIVQENPPNPILGVDPDPPSHAFGQQTRLEPVEWTFSIWNGGTGTLEWGVASDRDWIGVSPESGDSTGEWDPITVTVDTTILPLGYHSGSIYIDSTAGSDVGVVTVEIINVPPGADAGGPYSGTAGQDILFDGSGSLDGDGTITGYRWDWDNNGTWDTSWSGSPTATHSFPASGSYTVGLQIQDNDGDTGTDTCVCNIDLYSTIVYPPPGGGDYDTIQEAIDAVSEGAVIYLADGVFWGDGNRDLDYHGKAITVRSQSDNPESCIIDCQGSEAEPHRGFYFHSGEGGNSVLRGVTIRNGYVLDRGGAVYCCNSSEAAIQHCIISNNYADWGGGGIHYYSAGSPRLTDCHFIGNRGRGWIEVAGAGGLAIHGTAFRAFDCTFQDNEGLHGAAGAVSATTINGDHYCEFTNCTFTDNTSSGRGGAIYAWLSPLECTNCVLSGNTSESWGGAIAATNPTGPVTLTDCILAENVATVGGGALLIHDHEAVLTGCTIIGNSAPTGSGVLVWDTTANLLNVIIANGLDGAAIDGNATLTCCDIYGNAGGDYVGPIADQLGINGNISEDPLFCDSDNGDYHIFNISPCAPDNSPPGCGLIGALGVNCYQVIHQVCPDGSGDFLFIQDAIDAAADNDIIELCDSAFIGPGNRDINFSGKAVTVRSQSGDPTACIIDCLGVARGFKFHTSEDAGSVLQGITIKNGSADTGGGISCIGSSPTIVDCIIADNSASIEGGGVYCNIASPALTNCLLHGNTASLMGGAMICYSSDPVLTNCTLWGNWAGSQGGGLWLGYADPTLTNCILWGDTPEEVYVYSGTPEITYCDVQGGWAGSGNIVTNPLFVPGPAGCLYLSHLATGQTQQSPCVDAGNDSVQNLYLDGLTTRRDEVADAGVVDMGYHYPLTGETFVLGDFNGDGDVGPTDFAEFCDCFTGPCTASPCDPLYTDPCCGTGDFDGDADVDLADFAEFQTAFSSTGP